MTLLFCGPFYFADLIILATSIGLALRFQVVRFRKLRQDLRQFVNLVLLCSECSQQKSFAQSLQLILLGQLSTRNNTQYCQYDFDEGRNASTFITMDLDWLQIEPHTSVLLFNVCGTSFPSSWLGWFSSRIGTSDEVLLLNQWTLWNRT